MRGFIFSIGAWLAMMATLLSAAGAGIFANLLGFGGWLAPFVPHVIWGVSLGTCYGFLMRASRPSRKGRAAHG